MLAVSLMCLAVGGFATYLNALVYQHRQPVYDSMSYYSKLYRVMSTARYEGIGAAVVTSCQSSNTVSLPFLVGAVLGPFVSPHRAIGVWIQVAELWVFLLALVFFLRRVVGASALVTVFMCVPILCLSCLHYANGGLSDFRMDLSLALMYGATCLVYLTARETRRLVDFTLFGILIGASMLFRATAPIYLLAGLAPIAALDFWSSRSRVRDLGQLAVAGSAAVAVAGWFYVVNFDYLYYYYFVWNTDANARLPLTSSIRHLEFTVKHIGLGAGMWLASVWAVLLWRGRKCSSIAIRSSAGLWNWSLLWIAVAPLMVLVCGGAGHNPYVSMPAAVGIVCALIVPVARRLAASEPPISVRTLVVVSLACLLVAGVRGYRRHCPGEFASMASHQAVIRSVVADAQHRGLTTASYGTMHLDQLDTTSLQNVLLFDMPETHTRIARTVCKGVQLMPDLTFFRPAAADWNELPGGDAAGKIDWLVGEAVAHLDYLIMPEPDSIEQISDVLAHVAINQHLEALREEIIRSGQFQPISEPIVNGPREVVRLWRNVGNGRRSADERLRRH